MRLLFAFVALVISTAKAYDGSRVSGAYGPAVVQATLADIQNSCIFPNDHQLLRRLAWVESEFGALLRRRTTTPLANNAGIWQISNATLGQVQRYLHPAYKAAVKQQLNVDINKLSYAAGDLKVPIASAVVARAAVLLDYPNGVPLSSAGQADVWRTVYPKDSSTAKAWRNRISQIPIGCKSAGADILFIVDSSGSIGGPNFLNVRSFLSAIISGLTIGPHAFKIAVDDFSTSHRSVIRFNNYSSKAELLSQLDNVDYEGKGTCMLQEMIHADQYSFSSSNGLRPRFLGYPRIAVLITDGQPDCGASSSKSAVASVVRAMQSQGIVFLTVGVGSHIDKNWLESISSQPTCMSAYTLQDYSTLGSEFATVLKSRACRAVANIPAAANASSITNVVASNQSFYLAFQANTTAGITLAIKANTGAANVFVSLSTRNPSSADFDYKISSSSSANNVFISPSMLAPNCTRKKTACNSTTPLWAAVGGVGAGQTNFTLHYGPGDSSHNSSPPLRSLQNILLSLSFLAFLIRSI